MSKEPLKLNTWKNLATKFCDRIFRGNLFFRCKQKKAEKHVREAKPEKLCKHLAAPLMAKERKRRTRDYWLLFLLLWFLLPVCSESAHSSGLPPCRTQVPVSSSSPSLKIILTLVMVERQQDFSGFNEWKHFKLMKLQRVFCRKAKGCKSVFRRICVALYIWSMYRW